MHECKDCDHLMVCKYTDAGDGRCQNPQYFRDKHQMQARVNISPKLRSEMEQLEQMKEILSDLYKQLPKLDLCCDYCDYGKTMRPCVETDELIQCGECGRDCFCKDCGPDGSKWINSHMRAVLGFDKNVLSVKNQSKGET